jgi:hypothetical protein
MNYKNYIVPCLYLCLVGGCEAYGIGLLMAALDYVLDLMGFDYRFGSLTRLYVKKTRTSLRDTI